MKGKELLIILLFLPIFICSQELKEITIINPIENNKILVHPGELIKIKFKGDFDLEFEGKPLLIFEKAKEKLGLIGIPLEKDLELSEEKIYENYLVISGKNFQWLIPTIIKKKNLGIAKKAYLPLPPEKEKLLKNQKELIAKAYQQKRQVILPQKTFFWPNDPPIDYSLGKFGIKRLYQNKGQTINIGFHRGIDLSLPLGKEIKAINDGIVALAVGPPEEEFLEEGYFVIIDHGSNLFSLYFHLSEVFVENNQKVKRGEIIGLSGNSGNARTTSPHLHFGIKYLNIDLDPVDFFRIVNTFFQK